MLLFICYYLSLGAQFIYIKKKNWFFKQYFKPDVEEEKRG